MKWAFWMRVSFWEAPYSQKKAWNNTKPISIVKKLDINMYYSQIMTFMGDITKVFIDEPKRIVIIIDIVDWIRDFTKRIRTKDLNEAASSIEKYIVVKKSFMEKNSPLLCLPHILNRRGEKLQSTHSTRQKNIQYQAPTATPAELMRLQLKSNFFSLLSPSFSSELARSRVSLATLSSRRENRSEGWKSEMAICLSCSLARAPTQ